MKVVDMAKYCFVVLVAMFVFGLWNSAVQSAPVQETRKICTQREFNRIVLQLCRDYDTDIDKRGQSRGGSEDWSSEKDEEFQEESLKLWISPNEEDDRALIWTAKRSLYPSRQLPLFVECCEKGCTDELLFEVFCRFVSNFESE